jgi:DNA polymerase III epsilon subunit-like protein
MSVVFFDLETGGLLPTSPIIQIAAASASSPDFSANLGNFQVKIKFDEAKADKEALEINHYDPAVWKEEAVPPLEALAQFSQFLRLHSSVEMASKRTGKPYSLAQVGGHNIVRFDLERIQAEYKARDIFCPISYIRVLDTLQGAFWFFQRHSSLPLPENFKLGTLATYFGLPKRGELHEALSDVLTTVDLATRLIS